MLSLTHMRAMISLFDEQEVLHKFSPTMSHESTPLISTSTSTLSRAKKNMYWTLGCIYGATAVGIGAFGAHGLKKVVTDPAKLASFANPLRRPPRRGARAPENKLAAGLFTAGMTMFSGSIYALVLDPARFRFLGPVTPLGGLCLIGGWAALAF
ncbi:hypothetical protein E0Z10_g3626 [Xylaria hypoxylon]|uniref:DUF423-domain-containing protein n=1 Tax=Xylaria hypoxylon TaxID=37992 RepID=A0A4Z0Z704_9PEZI|nr:hypothetical protein E0Z10_g3626 [Xylaria hypoxylon]